MRVAVLVVLAAAFAGCGPTIAPSTDRATESLHAALSAWQAGKKCGRIEGQTPMLIAVDSAWQGGQKLSAFELLGPVDGASPPRIRVKLTLTAPGGSTETSYVLLGNDPLYVYRDVDFDRMLNMDNNPTNPKR
jgi:hypothetical protein